MRLQVRRIVILLTKIHLNTLPMRLPVGGIFLYNLPPAINITENIQVKVIIYIIFVKVNQSYS